MDWNARDRTLKIEKGRNEISKEEMRSDDSMYIDKKRTSTDGMKTTYEDNFLKNICKNYSSHNICRFLNNLSLNFKLFQKQCVPVSRHIDVEYAYSTVTTDNSFKNNLKISNKNFVTNDQNFLKIPQSSEKFLDSTANNESNINIVTNNEISKISSESYNDVDNSLMRITKQVHKNIEVAKAEFDTFLRRENPTQNTMDIT